MDEREKINKEFEKLDKMIKEQYESIMAEIKDFFANYDKSVENTKELS